MKPTIQVRILRVEKQYVAECLDLPVVTEAPTLDGLAANIREAIALHLEGEDPAQLGLVNNPTILATLELDAAAWCQDCGRCRGRIFSASLPASVSSRLLNGTLRAMFRQALRYISGKRTQVKLLHACRQRRPISCANS